MIKIKPTELAQASVEEVWDLLYYPENYNLWWDAETVSIEPAGDAHAGQKLSLQTTEFGKQWKVEMIFKEVDKVNHRISLEVKIPFGVIVREVISCNATEDGNCIIMYDAEIILPNGIKGKLMKLFFSKSFINSIKTSLNRLKTAAEKML